MAKFRGKDVCFSPKFVFTPDESDATATAADIAQGKTAYVDNVKITGTMATPSGNQDIETLNEYNVTAKATARVSAAERDKFIAGNIKDGVTLLGVTGDYTGVTPTGNVDIETLNEYNVSGKATARVSAADRAKIIPENIAQGVTILGVVGTHSGGGGGDVDINALVAGTLASLSITGSTLRTYAFYFNSGLETFVAPNVTAIPDYCFQNAANLTTYDLSAVTSIGQQAFMSCTKWNGSVLTASAIGEYACQNFAKNGQGFAYRPASSASVGQYAFTNAKITEIIGAFSAIGAYAFRELINASSQYTLLTLTAVINGTIGTYAFEGNRNVTAVNLSGSNITDLGTYAFEYMGYSRSNPSSNPLVFDLSDSTFQTVSTGAFRYHKYSSIFLPESVNTIASNAFSNADHVNVFIPSATPPTLQSTGAFGGTYTVFIPWGENVTYANATNWSTIAANLKGYAPAGTFTAGDTLPAYNKEGYGVTWYSDAEMTTQVSTCPAGSPVLYCAFSTSKVKLVVVFDIKGAGTIAVTDSSSNPVDVSLGYMIVETGDVYTLTAGSSEQGYTVLFKVDGTSVTSPYTLTVGSTDVAVEVNAYSGGYNPDFDQATWAELKAAVLAGMASVYAPYIGHTKQVTLSTNEVVEFMLVDTTGQLYDYADNSGKAGLILQQVNCLATSGEMNISQTNTGGYNVSGMATVTIPAFVNTLPSEVRDVISEVKIVRDSGGTSSSLTTGTGYAFLAAEKEISSIKSHSVEIEFNALSTFEYWQSHTQQTDRIKILNGSAYRWWLSSSGSNYSGNFCIVGANGNLSNIQANYSSGVVPCIAI